MSLDEIPKPNIFNKAADYWRYKIGANCFPFDTQKNRTIDGFEWKPYQSKEIPLEMHEHWKRNNMFDKGIAIILGKVWHREECKNYFLYVIDFDNQKAIDEVCTIVDKDGKVTKFTLNDIAKRCIVEQHSDDPSSCHIIGYSCKQLKTRSRVKPVT